MKPTISPLVFAVGSLFGALILCAEPMQLRDVTAYVDEGAIVVSYLSLEEFNFDTVLRLYGDIVGYSADHGKERIGQLKVAAAKRVDALRQAGVASVVLVVSHGDGKPTLYLLVPTAGDPMQITKDLLSDAKAIGIDVNNVISSPLQDYVYFGPKDIFDRLHQRVSHARNLNNMRSVALSIVNFESANGLLPPSAHCDKQGEKLLSWRVFVLPYLGNEQLALYQEFNLGEAWDSEHNRKLIQRIPDEFKHPSADVDPGKTVYVLATGKETLFAGKNGVHIGEVKDGISNTILIVESAPEHAVIWTKPSDWEVDLAKPFDGMLGARESFTAVFCDVHIRTFAKDTAAATMRAYLTKAAGDK